MFIYVFVYLCILISFFINIYFRKPGLADRLLPGLSQEPQSPKSPGSAARERFGG